MTEQHIHRSFLSRLVRIARHAIAALSLILFAGVMVLWFGGGISQYSSFGSGWPAKFTQYPMWEFGYGRQEIGSYTDRAAGIGIRYFQPMPPMSRQTLLLNVRSMRTISSSRGEFDWIGSKLEWDWDYRTISPTQTDLQGGVSIQIRFWQPAILLLIPPVFLWLIPALDARLIRKIKYVSGTPFPVCPRCGYDLRATPDLCPECGTIPPPAVATAPFVSGFRSELKRMSATIAILPIFFLCVLLSIASSPTVKVTSFPPQWRYWSGQIALGENWRRLVWPAFLLPIAWLIGKSSPRLLLLTTAHLAVAGLLAVAYKYLPADPGRFIHALIEIVNQLEPCFIPAEIWFLLIAFQSISVRLPGQPLNQELQLSRWGLCAALGAFFAQKLVIALVWIFEGSGERFVFTSDPGSRTLMLVCGLFWIHFAILTIRFRRVIRRSLKNLW